MSFEKFESPAESPEELGEKKEEFETREKGDTFPTPGHFKLELAADLELLKNEHVRPIKGPKENPWDKDAEVDMTAVVKIMEGHAKAFSAAKEKEDVFVERTNLPDKIEMERGMEAKLASVEKTLRERNLLPDDFDKKKSLTSPASVSFEADAAGGAFTPDKENPAIMIGGRLSRMFGSRVQETAQKFNVEISESEAVDLAMTFFAAHEWGHYLNFVENSLPEDLEEDRPDGWSTRANEVRHDIDWITDKFDRLPAFHEWVCQSIGDQVLQAELEKKEISPEVATQIKDLFTEDPDDIVGSYRQLAEWADDRQLPTYRVINAVNTAARELREAGREDLASQIGGSFHFVGYCLKPLEKSELEYVLTGKRDNTRENPPDSEKTARWERVLGRVEEVKDRLGKGIDENAKETVVAFLVNEFPTQQSCEGHIEERFGKMRRIDPYITLGVDDVAERYVGEAEIKKKIADQFNIAPGSIDRAENDAADTAYWNYITEHNTQETPAYQEMRAKNEELEKRAASLLDEFYKDRDASKQPRLLRIKTIGPAGYASINADRDNEEDIAESNIEKQQMELREEQAEMVALTEFLKEKFFAGK